MPEFELAGGLITFSTPVIAVLAVLAVVEIALDVIALIDLYRRPVAQIVTGNKWIWLAIILLVNILGAVAYLAIGRNAAVAASEKPPAGDRSRPQVEGIVDSLYPKPDAARRS